jgi:hypothetical protein
MAGRSGSAVNQSPFYSTCMDSPKRTITELTDDECADIFCFIMHVRKPIGLKVKRGNANVRIEQGNSLVHLLMISPGIYPKPGTLRIRARNANGEAVAIPVLDVIRELRRLNVSIDVAIKPEGPTEGGWYLCQIKTFGELGWSYHWEVVSWHHTAEQGDCWNLKHLDAGSRVVRWEYLPENE